MPESPLPQSINPTEPTPPEATLTVHDLKTLVRDYHPDTRIYLQTADGTKAIQKVKEGRAPAGQEQIGRLLLTADPKPDTDGREIWPTPEFRDGQPGGAALAQALDCLAQATIDHNDQPCWRAAAPQCLSTAMDGVYQAIANRPQIPTKELPALLWRIYQWQPNDWTPSNSSPDEIPYSLTRLFRLQELLKERFSLDPGADHPELPPGSRSLAAEEAELLNSVKTDLEKVSADWQAGRY